MTPSSKLVVIPSPIHGQDMPRKMLRRLAGSPLLCRMIRIAESSAAAAENVLVITDDDEAALLAERMGCHAVLHPSPGKTGHRFGWPQIYDSIEACEKKQARRFERVAVLKPDTPLLQAGDIEKGEELLDDGEVDTVVVLGKTDLANGHRRGFDVEHRTSLPKTGEQSAFVISKRQALSLQKPFGQRVKYAYIPDRHAFEVRSSHDWWVCEKLLAQKRIVFVVAGFSAVGMGHVYRSLLLAHELMDHQVEFLCTRDSDLAARHLAANRIRSRVQTSDDLATDVLELKPDLVINDFLDTTAGYIQRLKERSVRVVNIEDMGSGAAEADLVINALYEQEVELANHRVGPKYFCLRDEFTDAAPAPFRAAVRHVLITFGGTDAPDLTRRIVELIFPVVKPLGIRLSIVTGPGYAHAKKLQRRVGLYNTDSIEIANGTKRMSEYMARADLAFSSAGRTVFELVTMHVPSIILAANEREESHTFASAENGLTYLGRHDAVDDQAILQAFENLLSDADRRRQMHQRMQKHDFRAGKQRVIDEILKVLYAPVEEENSLCPA
jgi:spore coat polysaccharide biosynthesis predicted glycosyltransferase SpsG/CMP-N-acetylneuraminic acid synthetase